MSTTIIIAEAGVNHNGSLQTAYSLIDAAADAGVDVVKFQTFKTESLVTKNAKKADYQNRNENTTTTQFEMLKKLEFGLEEFKKINDYCIKKKILFCSTPFDFESIELLRDNFNMPFWKIPSGEITNLPYLKRIAALGQNIILSTGMSTLDEVRDAVNVLFDCGIVRNQLTLLHCTTEYPALIESVNLKAMQTLSRTFETAVGYSDHTEGIEIPVAAVALGATVIEKHFTLDKTMDGPDHKASLEPHELKAMVSAIRNVEKSLGNGEKMPLPVEIENRKIARKSIVAKCPISQGDIFSNENLTVKRPGTGISPMQWNAVIGQKAIKNFNVDEMVQL